MPGGVDEARRPEHLVVGVRGEDHDPLPERREGAKRPAGCRRAPSTPAERAGSEGDHHDADEGAAHRPLSALVSEAARKR